MTLQNLKYLDAIARHLHFGKAAEDCNVGQSTLSMQIRKLESDLGVRLVDRNRRGVYVTHVGYQILGHVRRALGEVREIEAIAQSARDPLDGPLRLGVIPTLAPYLMPLILKPMRKAYPKLTLELWEDQTKALIEGLRSRKLDAALLATPADAPESTAIELFREPFIAAVPPDHHLARSLAIYENGLSPDLLVLPEGHCLADQAKETCGSRAEPVNNPLQTTVQAATLETLVNLVAAGYGTTLIPALAAESLSRLGIVLVPFLSKPFRTIRLVSRPNFARPQALRALEKIILQAVREALPEGFKPAAAPVENLPKTPKKTRK